MGILNFSTTIPVEKTVAEIEKLLSQNKAQRILKEFDGAGSLTSISFIISTEYGPMPIKLPMNVRAVMQVINNQAREYTVRGRTKSRLVPKRFIDDMEQAKRVGWRIIKDWLEAQCALLQLQMVKVQEIFLPYVVMKDGKTFYEQIEDRKFNGMLLLEGGEVEEQGR